MKKDHLQENRSRIKEKASPQEGALWGCQRPAAVLAEKGGAPEGPGRAEGPGDVQSRWE